MHRRRSTSGDRSATVKTGAAGSTSETMGDAISSEAAGRRNGRGWRRAAIGFAGLALVWTFVWIGARGYVLAELDRRIAELGQRGLEVACAEPSVGGFPLALELNCREPGVAVAARGTVLSAQSLRIGVAVWRPLTVTAEAEGPLVAEDGRGGSLRVSWRGLRARVGGSFRGPERLALDGEGLAVEVGAVGSRPLRIAAEHAAIGLARSGAAGEDLDLTVGGSAVALANDGRPIGPKRFDVSATATAIAGLAPGGVGLAGFADSGGRVEPLRFRLSSGGVTLAGKGGLRLRADGLLDGTVGVAARGIESLATGGARDLGPELTTLIGGFVIAGKASDDPDLPGRRLDLVIEAGRARLGRLALPPLPPLFVPPSP